MAKWIVAMEDGRKSRFRWIDRESTGLASASIGEYHGPGRAPGNAITTLLVGHRLTGDPQMRELAERLVRRCVHPSDHVEAQKLGDPEQRWSYTVFLYALGEYLDEKIERGELDQFYAYARASLLHYTRWMAEHEYPYLDKPELLEFPNETWAAQELRKCDVFLFAAKYSAGEERGRFLERACFFFRAGLEELLASERRFLTRPHVLVLRHGRMLAHFSQSPEAAPAADVEADSGVPSGFLSQRARILGLPARFLRRLFRRSVERANRPVRLMPG
jgi:hypothetical protein